MSENIPTRGEALALLKKYNKTESLIKHALAVEGVMRYFARKRNEDEEKWGRWLDILIETCNDPAILGLSDHFLYIGKKV